MDTRRIRYFVVTAEELHFGRAARRLGISQPPLSQQIRALEDELGVTLLERNQRNVSLTAAGAVLLSEGRKILSSLDQARSLTMRAAQGLHGSLSVGFITPTEYSFLPALVRSYQQKFPGIALQLHELMTDTQIENLKSGTIDIGLVGGPFDHPDFECQEIMREPLIAAIPADHMLAKGSSPISIKRLESEALIMFPREIAPILFDQVIVFCRNAGFSPRLSHEIRQSQAIVSLVSAGLGIGIVPASIRHLLRKGVVYRRFMERTPSAAISIAWQSHQPSQAIINFVRLARSSATGHGGGS